MTINTEELTKTLQKKIAKYFGQLFNFANKIFLPGFFKKKEMSSSLQTKVNCNRSQ